ncbi:MAG: transglycosylase SLT domain-containing protein, partial [Paracoccaceae bacterium]
MPDLWPLRPLFDPVKLRPLVIALALSLALPGLALGTSVPAPENDPADPANICIAAARAASISEGVPFSVLMAISLNETGRKKNGAFRPWPWTVNMEGAGHWFETPQQALNYAEKEKARGAVSFDIGCFQINFRWHGENFQSVAHMFDPTANATYAARFLRDLYAEKGSWEVAAGAYHSRTPAYAERYAARFVRFRQDMVAADEVAGAIPDIPDIVLAASDYGLASAPDAPRVNNY